MTVTCSNNSIESYTYITVHFVFVHVIDMQIINMIKLARKTSVGMVAHLHKWRIYGLKHAIQRPFGAEERFDKRPFRVSFSENKEAIKFHFEIIANFHGYILTNNPKHDTIPITSIGKWVDIVSLQGQTRGYSLTDTL